MPTEPLQTIELLRAARNGKKESFDQLFEYLNTELQKIAFNKLYDERPNHTLDVGALISSLYEKLYNQKELAGDDRRGFLAICSRSMRQILIDHARKKNAARRGAGALRVTLTNWNELPDQKQGEEILALNDAIDKLTSVNEAAGQLVVFRFFGGMSTQEAAKELGLTYNQARVKWSFAKAWISEALKDT